MKEQKKKQIERIHNIKGCICLQDIIMLFIT